MLLAGGGGGGGGLKILITGIKNAFQTSYIIAVLIKILFESEGRGGGLVIGCIFCLQIDGLTTEGRAYLISGR